MADYFQEFGWEPIPSDGAASIDLLHLARLLREYHIFEHREYDLAPPAAKVTVECLPDISITNNDTQCPVCLKEHEKGGTAKQLPCKHMFHSDCILPWLTKTNSCPLCRHELPTDDEDYEAYRKEKLRAKEREKDIENLHNSMFS